MLDEQALERWKPWKFCDLGARTPRQVFSRHHPQKKIYICFHYFTTLDQFDQNSDFWSRQSCGFSLDHVPTPWKVHENELEKLDTLVAQPTEHEDYLLSEKKSARKKRAEVLERKHDRRSDSGKATFQLRLRGRLGNRQTENQRLKVMAIEDKTVRKTLVCSRNQVTSMEMTLSEREKPGR